MSTESAWFRDLTTAGARLGELCYIHLYTLPVPGVPRGEIGVDFLPRTGSPNLAKVALRDLTFWSNFLHFFWSTFWAKKVRQIEVDLEG
jgi:hypothetical protein